MSLRQSPDAPTLKASWQMGLANPTPGIFIYIRQTTWFDGFKKPLFII